MSKAFCLNFKRLICTVLIFLLSVCVLPLSPSSAAETVPTVHIWTGHQGEATADISLEPGKTYTFTALYTSRGSSAGVYVDNKRVVSGKNALNGAYYDPLTGFLSYTFTAQSAKSTILFCTYNENGNVAADSGMEYNDVHVWFAKTLLKDEAGVEKELSVNSWSYFYADCNKELTEKASDFFGDDLLAGHIWTSNQGAAIVTADVKSGEEYTFEMYLKACGSSAGVSVDGIYIFTGNTAADGAVFDTESGKLTYSFVPKNDTVSILNTTYNKYGCVSSDSGMQYDDVHIWYSQPRLISTGGEEIDISVPKWSYQYCNNEIISSKGISFKADLKQCRIYSSGNGQATLEAEVKLGWNYTVSLLTDAKASGTGASVNGTSVLSNGNALNGAEYYANINRLSYSFTATDNKLSLALYINGDGYTEKELRFAGVTVTAEDNTTAVYNSEDFTFSDVEYKAEELDFAYFPRFGAVRGSIERYGSTEAPISVKLISEKSGQTLYEASVYENPQYLIENVPYGNYRLSFSKEGHISREYAINVDRDEVISDTVITQIGDTNIDGAVDIRDIVNLKKASANMTAEKYRCDISGDGSVNAEDLAELRGLLLENNELPRDSLNESLILLFSEDTTEEYMPCVAYQRNGKICDMMFDSFIMAWIWHYLPVPDKANISVYFDKLFESGINMDALDEAVGEAKKALGCEDYRAGVWIGFWIPDASLGTSFGSVAGKELDFSLRSDREFAMRWQMNEALRRFRAKNYKNLKLVGFHCISESYDTSNGDFLDTIKDFNAMIAESGLKTNMGPYYNAKGWLENERMGFSWNTVSPNYFKCGSPNAGDITRLDSVGNVVKQFNVGVALELEAYNKTAVGVLRDYMQRAKACGYYFTYHTWYMVNGAKGIGYIYNNTDEEIRSVYDDIYRWIHRRFT